jgi:hypothetical protein
MRSAPMPGWLRAEQNDVWEQVDRWTYGTLDQDEDVLWLSHARVEQRARTRGPIESAEAKQRAVLKMFPEALRRRNVG